VCGELRIQPEMTRAGVERVPIILMIGLPLPLEPEGGRIKFIVGLRGHGVTSGTAGIFYTTFGCALVC